MFSVVKVSLVKKKQVVMETCFVCRLDAFQDLDWNSISYVVLNLLPLIGYLKHWKTLVGKPLWQIHERGTSVESLKYKPMNIHIRSELTKGISFFYPRHFKWNICKKKKEETYLAVSCLRAFRNVSGWNSSERSRVSDMRRPFSTMSTHPCMARVRATILLRYCMGSSGPSHLFCQESGV